MGKLTFGQNKTRAGALDRAQLISGGANTFDGGQASIQWDYF